jgi:hypothetical protein
MFHLPDPASGFQFVTGRTDLRRRVMSEKRQRGGNDPRREERESPGGFPSEEKNLAVDEVFHVFSRRHLGRVGIWFVCLFFISFPFEDFSSQFLDPRFLSPSCGKVCISLHIPIYVMDLAQIPLKG